MTGAAGFIGSNLSLYLLEGGHEVVAVDSFERPCEALAPILRARVKDTYKLNVLDMDSLVKVLDGVEAVVHLAAYIDVDESVRMPYKYIWNNVLGTESVLEASRRAGVEKFIFVSSAAVYGEPVRLPVREDDSANPISPYGYSKLLGEYLSRMYWEVYGLDVLVLRLFNVYGYGQSGEYAGVITKFIERVLRGEPPIIFGDGLQTRDFIHVVDVCRAIEKALKYGRGFNIINIASGKPVSINDLARLILDAAGLDLEPIYMPPREGDIKHSYADISKAMVELGFTPEIELGIGVETLLRRFGPVK